MYKIIANMGSDFPPLVSTEFLIYPVRNIAPLSPPTPAITVNENKEHFIEGVCVRKPSKAAALCKEL